MKIFDRWSKPKQYDRPVLKPEQQPIPQLESAIERNNASFSQLLEVEHGTNHCNKDEENVYPIYHPYILKAFETANGRILHFYQSKRSKAGIALTESAFFAHYDFQRSKSDNELKAQELLVKCDRLAIEARRFLNGPELHTCSELIYSAAENLLQFIDTPSADEDTGKNLLKIIDEQLKYAETYHKEVLPLAYQRDYFIGMIQGIGWLCGILFAILAIGFVLSINWPNLLNTDFLEYKILMASLIGGGLGAIVSMMSRLSGGDVNLKGKAGPIALRRAGALRPFIGAIFGAVIYAVIESRLISHIDPNAGNKLLLFATLGFVAGFSERWAPDMLSSAVGDIKKDEEGQSTTNMNQKPPSM